MKIKLRKTKTEKEFKELKKMLKMFHRETGETNGKTRLEEMDLILVDDKIVGFEWILPKLSGILTFFYIKRKYRKQGLATQILLFMYDEGMFKAVDAPSDVIVHTLIKLGLIKLIENKIIYDKVFLVCIIPGQPFSKVANFNVLIQDEKYYSILHHSVLGVPPLPGFGQYAIAALDKSEVGLSHPLDDDGLSIMDMLNNKIMKVILLGKEELKDNAIKSLETLEDEK